MPNYINAKIYKICGGEEVYVGSTCRTLLQRFTSHKSEYNGKYKKCNSSILFEKYGIENCTIELIQDFPCDSRKDLHEREGYYMRTMTCVNRFIAGRKQKEYNYIHREKRKEYMKEYKQTDKQKEYMKEYNEKNRVKINQRQTEYYQRKKLANGTAAATAQIVEPIE
jgi:hypothetical protein